MKDTYMPPEKWDLRVGKAVIPTVSFPSRFFLIGERQYEIRGTSELPNGDASHLVVNVETGEKREVSGQNIRAWIEQATK